MLEMLQTAVYSLGMLVVFGVVTLLLAGTASLLFEVRDLLQRSAKNDRELLEFMRSDEHRAMANVVPLTAAGGRKAPRPVA